MPDDKTIRWLHISDIHMGCRGEEIWRQVRDEFKHSIAENKDRLPIDLILVTGDITYQGAPEQFEMFDTFLNDLRGWLNDAGQATDPLVIPVPGNHDLVRPSGGARRAFRILDKFADDPGDEDILDLGDELWRPPQDAGFFSPLFGNYIEWLENSILPHMDSRSEVSFHPSHFPGDLSVHIQLEGKPSLSVVGLNSAWMQYGEGDYKGRIELFTQQLHSALGKGRAGSPLDALAGDFNLLLMHHPPAWLSEASYTRYLEEIHPPERFLLCLHGHMHEGRSEAAAVSGGKVRYQFQSPSLFGLEGYGTSKEKRAMGYTWGEVDAARTVRVRPLVRGLQGGRQVFFRDPSFPQDPDGNCRIRPLEDGNCLDIATDLAPWLERLIDDTGHIQISGIGSGVGPTKSAHRYPIEQLYTTLTSRTGAEAKGENESTIQGARVTLAELLSRHNLVLIEGQPGAGKTTFLHLVASMLARDILRRHCPDGPSWREKYLGSDGRKKPRVPLFLKLSGLTSILEKNTNGDDRWRLLDLLEASAGAETGNAVRRTHWENLLERGEAILLLDGLDEVADEGLRERVFAIFDDALRNWGECPVVVTSRPFGVGAVRDMDFHHAVIDPFGKTEIEEFIKRWIAAIYDRPVGRHPDGASGEKSTLIIDAVTNRPAIRRLAANPVMLTCLCVVHWNEGDLPEGRARVYQAVIRWLIASRNNVRENAGFADKFANKAFAALALAMMGGKEGKKVAVLDPESCAEAVQPLVQLYFPEGDARRLARDWLRFECLYSGIIEETADGNIRFWHLIFQEYLAAQQLAWTRDKEGNDNWWPVIEQRLENRQWQETVNLLPGVLFGNGDTGRVDALLRRIITLSREEPSGVAADARVFANLERVLEPMSAYEYPLLPDIAEKRRDLGDRILPMFERSGAAQVPVGVRIEAARALGRCNDPRLTGNTFIPVPGTGMELGKYPVTVAEYQGFVEAGGYDDPNPWDAEGWQIRQRLGWEAPDGWEEQVIHSNHPVVAVSWFEATAYCAWRSKEVDYTIRLPKEAEWEEAATPDGREFPWGDEEPDLERANYNFNVGTVTPVGIYPAGNGLSGHCDLAGNVWEWQEDFCS